MFIRPPLVGGFHQNNLERIWSNRHMKKKFKIFKGTVRQISLSPHGHPEGLFLDNGTFVRIAPHTLLKESDIKVGTHVEGTGELRKSKFFQTIKHAKLFIRGELVANDQIAKKEDRILKARHREINQTIDVSPEKLCQADGTIIALSTKKKGIVDRLLLSGGVSVHVPKSLDVSEEEVHIGDVLHVEGQGRNFGRHTFIKASFIVSSEGHILSA